MTKDNKIKIMLEALKSITEAKEDSSVKTYQKMEDIAKEAISRIEST